MDLDQTQVLPLEYSDSEEEENTENKNPAAHLKVLPQKGFPEYCFPLYKGLNTIGRNENCDIHIPDKALSKEHACIEIKGRNHLIYDKNSRNKTRKGKLFLLPEVHYDLKNEQELVFADIHCTYIINDKENMNCDNDLSSETQSLPGFVKPGLNSLNNVNPDESDECSNASSNLLEEAAEMYATNVADSSDTKIVQVSRNKKSSELSDGNDDETDIENENESIIQEKDNSIFFQPTQVFMEEDTVRVSATPSPVDRDQNGLSSDNLVDSLPMDIVIADTVTKKSNKLSRSFTPIKDKPLNGTHNFNIPESPETNINNSAKQFTNDMQKFEKEENVENNWCAETQAYNTEEDLFDEPESEKKDKDNADSNFIKEQDDKQEENSDSDMPATLAYCRKDNLKVTTSDSELASDHTANDKVVECSQQSDSSLASTLLYDLSVQRIEVEKKLAEQESEEDLDLPSTLAYFTLENDKNEAKTLSSVPEKSLCKDNDDETTTLIKMKAEEKLKIENNKTNNNFSESDLHLETKQREVENPNIFMKTYNRKGRRSIRFQKTERTSTVTKSNLTNEMSLEKEESVENIDSYNDCEMPDRKKTEEIEKQLFISTELGNKTDNTCEKEKSRKSTKGKRVSFEKIDNVDTSDINNSNESTSLQSTEKTRKSNRGGKKVDVKFEEEKKNISDSSAEMQESDIRKKSSRQKVLESKISNKTNDSTNNVNDDECSASIIALPYELKSKKTIQNKKLEDKLLSQNENKNLKIDSSERTKNVGRNERSSKVDSVISAKKIDIKDDSEADCIKKIDKNVSNEDNSEIVNSKKLDSESDSVKKTNKDTGRDILNSVMLVQNTELRSSEKDDKNKINKKGRRTSKIIKYNQSDISTVLENEPEANNINMPGKSKQQQVSKRQSRSNNILFSDESKINKQFRNDKLMDEKLKSTESLRKSQRQQCRKSNESEISSLSESSNRLVIDFSSEENGSSSSPHYASKNEKQKKKDKAEIKIDEKLLEKLSANEKLLETKTSKDGPGEKRTRLKNKNKIDNSEHLDKKSIVSDFPVENVLRRVSRSGSQYKQKQKTPLKVKTETENSKSKLKKQTNDESLFKESKSISQKTKLLTNNVETGKILTIDNENNAPESLLRKRKLSSVSTVSSSTVSSLTDKTPDGKIVKRNDNENNKQINKSPRTPLRSASKELKICTPELRHRPDFKAKIMFTGLIDKLGEKVAKDLGGELVDSVHECTHLVTDKVRRTCKFLCIIGQGKPIVTPAWLEKCKQSRKFVDCEPFIIKDQSSEKQYKFILSKSLQKASENSLLSSYKIFVTLNVKPEPNQMKDIIECAGGKFLKQMPLNKEDNVIIISCEEDKKICSPAQKACIPIVNAEFILTGMLRQEVDIDSYRIFIEDSQQTSSARKRKITPTIKEENKRSRK